MDYHEKTRDHFLICRRDYFTPTMQAFLRDPETFLQTQPVTYLKYQSGEPTTVAIVEVDDRRLVLKRYNVKGFWHGLKRLLQRNRAWRSWKNSLYLEKLGIATPRAVAVVMKQGGAIRREAYFLAEHVAGLSGHDVFYKKNYSADELKKIIGHIGKLLTRLYAARVSHDDFHHNNMVFLDGVPVLLDLDHMRIHRWNSVWFRHNFQKDIRNFLRVLSEINPAASEMAGKIFPRFPSPLF